MNILRKSISIIILVFFIMTGAISFCSAENAVNNSIGNATGNTSNNAIVESTTVDIATPAAILIDAKTGNILFEKSCHQRMYPASITKIMTAVLALEKANLQSKVTMTRNAVYSIEPGSSNVGFLEGEELTMEQLLYALMLDSANEAANGIAEAIGGSKEEFAKMMTARAKELGALDTNFANPNGLHDPNHYTTPYDMAMITKYAMSIPKFREIVSTTHYVLPPTNKMPKSKDFYNKNQLIQPSARYYYSDAIGVKTGYTTAAGSTLVSAASKDNKELIAVVMNAPIADGKSYMYVDSVKMFKYGFQNFELYKIFNKIDIIDKIGIRGTFKRVEAVAKDDVSILLPWNINRKDLKINKFFNDLYAPVKKGDVVGYITFEANGKGFGKVDLIANNDVNKSIVSILTIPKQKTFLSMTWFITKWTVFILFVAVIILIVSLICYLKYAGKKLKRKNKMKNKTKSQ